MELSLTHWIGIVAASILVPALTTAVVVASMGRSDGRGSTRSLVLFVGVLASSASGGLAGTIGWWMRAAAVEVFEQGFMQDCVAGFDVGSGELKRSTCTCAQEHLYEDGDRPSTVSRLNRLAKDPASSTELQDVVQRAIAPCAGEITDLGWRRGCMDGCSGGAGAARELCESYCDCSVQVLRREHPGEQGTLWLLQNLFANRRSAEGAALVEVIDGECEAP